MPGIWCCPGVWASGLACQPRTAGASLSGRSGIITQTYGGGRSGAVPGTDLASSCKAALDRASGLVCEVLTKLSRACGLPPSSFLAPAKPCVTILHGPLEKPRCSLQLRSPGRSICWLLSPSSSTERLMEGAGACGLVEGWLHPSCSSHHGEISWRLKTSLRCTVELLG